MIRHPILVPRCHFKISGPILFLNFDNKSPSSEAREMAQGVKVLASQARQPELGPRIPHKKSDVVHICISSPLQEDTRQREESSGSSWDS